MRKLSVVLQPRDREFLRALLDSRIMTLAHISALYFDNKREMAKKRVQKLKAAGYLRERPRQRTAPSILSLTRTSYEWLTENGALPETPRLSLAEFEQRGRVSELTLKHELDVLDVKTALVCAINSKANLKVAYFSTWPALLSFEASGRNGGPVLVRPDGFMRVHERAIDGTYESAYFLEVDRSTESLQRLTSRCHCYADHYRSGGFARSNGGTAEQFKEFPFRVLVICKSDQRQTNLARCLLQDDPPIRTQVWLTTLTEAVSDPLGRIWLSPADFEQVVAPGLLSAVKRSLLNA